MSSNSIFQRVLHAFLAALVFGLFMPAHAADKLRVGYLPIAEDSPKFVGVKRGIFQKHGLDVELVRFENGPDQVSAVLSGAIQVGSIGAPGLVFAASGGRNLVGFLNNGSNRKGASGYEYYAGIVVPEKSSIKNLGDLKGKRLAVNVLKSNSEIQTILQVQRWNRENPSNTIDLEKDVRFIVLPFGSMPGALERNLVDAASLLEPFMTQLSTAQPVRVVAPVEYAMPEWPISIGVAERDYAKKNADALERYKQAWAEAVAWIEQNRAATSGVIQPYTGVETEILSRIPLPSWSGDMKAVRESTGKIMQGMLQAKLIKADVPLDKYIVDNLRSLP